MSALSRVASTAPDQATDLIRVMIVDDAVVVRGLLTRWFNDTPQISVIGSFRNGRLGVEALETHDPDIVILDIEMPEMDGLTALPLILKRKPTTKVIMSSTLTTRNADASLKAMRLGATDYIPKPEGNHGVTTSAEFRTELVDKILAIGKRAVQRRLGISAQPAIRPPSPASSETQPVTLVEPQAASVALRRVNPVVPRIMAVGSSTGGPQALLQFFPSVAASLKSIPTVLTQHMPPSFTALLAKHISQAAGIEAKEGQDGEILRPGVVYVAPGGHHMVIEGSISAPVVRLQDGPAINYCKPAVDPLFASLVKVYSNTVLGVILTGMGADGAVGAKQIADAGGNVVTQDEETSVVWGMPGAVVQIGAPCAVLPLSQVGQKVTNLIQGARL